MHQEKTIKSEVREGSPNICSPEEADLWSHLLCYLEQEFQHDCILTSHHGGQSSLQVQSKKAGFCFFAPSSLISHISLLFITQLFCKGGSKIARPLLELHKPNVSEILLQ